MLHDGAAIQTVFRLAPLPVVRGRSFTASSTENLIRVMAEGDDGALVKHVVAEVSAAVKAAG
ncbi:MAG: hypothetical protein Q8S03_01780 [Brevundimonas sp.]|uniref:hypothetical protein n=1 Tax=Brevundimonas sp. TaxID=1871086 RepID=UPI0027364C74|nr:hypothetical protein [Brevundimonas sp.]MDP3403387.1 hypothetical protein [Brevundimonas sp.]